MPTTPIHFAFNLTTYYLISILTPIEFLLLPCIFLFSAELIDLDHLLSKPIYVKKRNSLKTHILHKNWKLILIFSIITLPFYPLSFLGIGLASHILLDYTYTKYWLKM